MKKYLKTYLIVPVSVETDKSGGPEGVDSHGAEEDIGVPGLVVVGNPSSNESPEGFDPWVLSNSGRLLWLATYIIY